MADAVTGALLLGEMAVLFGVIGLFDPSDYIINRRNADDEWFARIDVAMDAGAAENLLSDTEYTKANALSDSDAFAASMFRRNAIDAVAPIYKAPCVANGYNSPITMMLANDALSKAFDGAVSAKIQTVSDYAGVQQAKIISYVNLLSLGQGTNAICTAATSPHGVDIGQLVTKIQESIGQFAGAVSASVDLVGSVSSFFGC